MLSLTHASLATVDELFRFKNAGQPLEPFPGYTADQWGVKAHNRPWIEAVGNFSKGQKVIEVGGAYSLLPKYLGEKYGVEAWIGDDFGASGDEAQWSRWGNPRDLPAKYPSVRYVFENFGKFSPAYPDRHFDRIFSVSTLEHIPPAARLEVFKDMNRCLAPGGRAIHSIDIGTDWLKVALSSLVDCVPVAKHLRWRGQSEIRAWIDLIRDSGARISTSIPHPARLLDRRTLVESPDVVYRFYPPNDTPKRYAPAASLLVIIDDV